MKFDLDTGCRRAPAKVVASAVRYTGWEKPSARSWTIGSRSQLEGYTDAAASEKEVLRDVFAPGDRWYRTGDLMRQDAQGFFYFVDRVGDTFRWKGENVSTTEVAEVIGACVGVTDVAVYGVKVPTPTAELASPRWS